MPVLLLLGSLRVSLGTGELEEISNRAVDYLNCILSSQSPGVKLDRLTARLELVDSASTNGQAPETRHGLTPRLLVRISGF